jgi:superfamily II DNA or RNA helicase
MIKSRAAKLAGLPAPMKHQVRSLAHSRKNPRVFDTSDPGTGKTGVRIWRFAERRRKGGGCLLVLAPRSLLVTAWANDFKKFAPDMKVSVAWANNREKAFAEDADVYITNHDAVKWLNKQKKPFWARFDELAVDESTAFKHHTSQRSYAALRVAKHFEYRTCMTATPNPGSITDVWHQVMLLDEGKRLGDSFYAFRAACCEPKLVKVSGREVTDWVDKDGAEEAVFGLLADITVRHKLAECADIPPNHIYTMEFQLSPKQRRAYDLMEGQHVLPLIGGRDKQVAARLKGKAVEVTAINAGTVVNKLLQICAGAVYGNDRDVNWIDDERAKLVLDLVEARQHSLVYFLWDHQRDQLVEEAKKRGITCCVVDGSKTDAERTAAVMQYQAGMFRVMFAHPQAVAHGQTLTRGTTTIWTSPTPNLEWFVQGNGRQRRIGQTQKTETIVLLADVSVEQRIYHDILMPKNRRMRTLLELFETWESDAMKEAA